MILHRRLSFLLFFFLGCFFFFFSSEEREDKEDWLDREDLLDFDVLDPDRAPAARRRPGESRRDAFPFLASAQTRSSGDGASG